MLRKRLFAAIGRALKEDPACKHYEGTIDHLVQYQDYFEDTNASSGSSYHELTVHCYVIGD